MPLTLLSGMNGSRKNSVMQALAMLRQSYDTGFLQQHSWLLNGKLVELGNGGDVLPDNPVGEGQMSVTVTSQSGDGRISQAGDPVRYDPKETYLHPLLTLRPRLRSSKDLVCLARVFSI